MKTKTFAAYSIEMEVKKGIESMAKDGINKSYIVNKCLRAMLEKKKIIKKKK